MKDGEPCNHTGCLNHVTHPCEGCGRIAGITVIGLTTDQNKRIAKELGLCWHEWRLDKYWKERGAEVFYCKCGTSYENGKRIEDYRFDTKEGFWLIIENGPKMDWWDEFVKYTPSFVYQYDNDEMQWWIRQNYLGPRLAVALNEWLEGREI